MKIASHHSRTFGAAALIAADALFFSSTNASTVTSVALIVGFLLAIATCYLIVQQFLRLLTLYGIRAGRHRKRVAASITGVTAVVLALVTIGQFTVKDLVVITPLIIIGAAYITISRKKANAISRPSGVLVNN